MAIFSGRLQYDAERTSLSDPSNPGIANVPMVLFEPSSGMGVAVLTDSGGNFEFVDVPTNDYLVVELYGLVGVTAVGSASWNIATEMEMPESGGVCPPISYVDSPPFGATHLDCTTPNTVLVQNESGLDVTGLDILNGPVAKTSLGIKTKGENIIQTADFGTFGVASITTSNYGAGPIAPYLDMLTDLVYFQQTGTMTPYPVEGEYTVQNLLTNTSLQASGVMWRIAGQELGNETDRFMWGVYMAGAPQTVFGDTVTVQPNTDYLVSFWTMTTFVAPLAPPALPQFGLELLDSEGTTISSEILGSISINENCPEWVQMGQVINSGDNTELTIKIYGTYNSVVRSATPVYFAMDSIEMRETISGIKNAASIDFVLSSDEDVTTIVSNQTELTELDISMTKSQSCDVYMVGGSMIYCVSVANNSDLDLTNLRWFDVLDSRLTYVTGTFTVDDNPETPTEVGQELSWMIDNLYAGQTIIICFETSVGSV